MKKVIEPKLANYLEEAKLNELDFDDKIENMTFKDEKVHINIKNVEINGKLFYYTWFV